MQIFFTRRPLLRSRCLHRRISAGAILGAIAITTTLGPHLASAAVNDFLWVDQIGGSGASAIAKVSVDSFGNTVIAGDISGAVDVDPGPAVFTLDSANGPSFVAQYDSTGALIWALSTQMSIAGLAVGPSNEIAVVGNAWNNIDADPGPGVVPVVVAGMSEAVFVTLHADGSTAQVASFGGSGFDIAREVVFSPAGKILVGGVVAGVGDLDPGPGVVPYTTLDDRQVQAYVSQFDATGNLEWSAPLEGTQSSQSQAIAVDAAGTVIRVANFSGTIDVDPSSQ